MPSRAPYLAGSWYPADAGACGALLDGFFASASLPPGLGRVLGGLAPHAGWLYSGPTAALVFAALGEPAPETVVLFGVPHRVGIRCATVSASDAWGTPLGPVPVDRDLGEALLAAAPDLVARDEAPHPPGENSIEVLVPFVRRRCPDARILPVSVPSGPPAVEFGEAAGKVFRSREEAVAVVGSTDLTHYGAAHFGFAPRGSGPEGHRWAKEVNDRSFLDRVEALDPAGALRDARAKHSACGGGAAAAALAAALELGATKAVVLEHTTSHEVRPAGEPTDFVGYAAVAFCA